MVQVIRFKPSVDHRIAWLMDQQRHPQLAKNCREHACAVVGGNPNINACCAQPAPARPLSPQAACPVKAVRIVYLHNPAPSGPATDRGWPADTCGYPTAIGARPHIIASFGENDHLVDRVPDPVPVSGQMPLSTAMRRTIIRQIKMCDAGIKGGQCHAWFRAGLPKIVPQAE